VLIFRLSKKPFIVNAVLRIADIASKAISPVVSDTIIPTNRHPAPPPNSIISRMKTGFGMAGEAFGLLLSFSCIKMRLLFYTNLQSMLELIFLKSRRPGGNEKLIPTVLDASLYDIPFHPIFGV
jgi:hypothetical protein